MKENNHFIDRLKERYNIDLSLKEYEELSADHFTGLFKKNWTHTLGVIEIKGTDVYVLYNNKAKIFSTAYPPEVGTDTVNLLYACFGRKLGVVAVKLYEVIKEEVDNERSVFSSDKEAAVYYWDNCNYPALLMDKYKTNKITPIRYCREVKKIIAGEHRKVEISLSPIPS